MSIALSWVWRPFKIVLVSFLKYRKLKAILRLIQEQKYPGGNFIDGLGTVIGRSVLLWFSGAPET